jgi:antitoxin MazE
MRMPGGVYASSVTSLAEPPIVRKYRLIKQCDYIIITPAGTTGMKTHIISIGNSRGIRIPKAILEQCRIEKDVELELENDKIILKPLRKTPRKTWTQAFQKMKSQQDDGLLIDDRLDLDEKDWEW